MSDVLRMIEDLTNMVVDDNALEIPVQIPDQDQDQDSEHGLDFDDESSDLIYIETVDNIVYCFQKDYLKNIILFDNIIKSDSTAGLTRESSIKLIRLDSRTMNLLEEYINHHMGNDYAPRKDNDKRYNEIMLHRWDIHYFDAILNSNDIEFNENIFKIVDYLMYDTFKSKFSCAMAYLPERHRGIMKNYADLFTTISLNQNNHEEEEKIDE